MICQIKKFFHPLGILWYKFLSYIEVLHVLSELSKLLELSELIELPEVFSSMKKCLFRGALRERRGSCVLLLFFFSSSSTSCTLYMLIPRHTGHFLRCLWALPDTKHRKGESLVHFPCATLLYMWYI